MEHTFVVTTRWQYAPDPSRSDIVNEYQNELKEEGLDQAFEGLYQGDTYGKLTAKLLEDPLDIDSKELVFRGEWEMEEVDPRIVSDKRQKFTIKYHHNGKSDTWVAKKPEKGLAMGYDGYAFIYPPQSFIVVDYQTRPMTKKEADIFNDMLNMNQYKNVEPGRTFYITK
mgnify:CR=1 FL=1